MSDPMMMGDLEPQNIAEASAARSKTKVSKTAEINAETAAKREERMQNKAVGGGGSMSKAPAPAPPPPVDKSPLLDKIGKYRDRFPDLKSRNKVSAKSTLEEIEDELHYYEKQLGSKEEGMGVNVVIAALTGLEQYNPFGLKLQGLGQVARDNSSELAPVIDELMIKYSMNVSVGPEMRLAVLLGGMIYTVHQANSGDPRVVAALQKMSQKAKPGPTDL